MATISALRTGIALWLGVGGWGHDGTLASDYRTDLFRIPPGEMWSQIQLSVEDVNLDDSNTPRVAVRTRVAIHYRLAVDEAEADYTYGIMAAMLEAFTDVREWRKLAAVYDVAEGGLESEAPERDGNVISWAVETSLLLTP